MKRLPFKNEHVPKVKDGSKEWTSRWSDLKLYPGDIVSATTGKNGKPAFLIPASEGFATVEILSHDVKFWQDFTENDAARCGVTKDWYLKERPSAMPLDRIHLYHFRLLPVSPPNAQTVTTPETSAGTECK